MAKHDMGPSTVAGFEKQCRKCKALDTEIKFALGQVCPVDDDPQEPSQDNIEIDGRPVIEINGPQDDDDRARFLTPE